MRKDDEEFLARVRKEEKEHGLELRPDIPAKGFHELMRQLISKPPAPKRLTKSKANRRKHNRKDHNP